MRSDATAGQKLAAKVITQAENRVGCKHPSVFHTLFCSVTGEKKTHSCACWMATLAMPTLTSAEQEFHPL